METYSGVVIWQTVLALAGMFIWYRVGVSVGLKRQPRTSEATSGE
jgi:hypothetical protein